jgi:hypothetical protein
LERTLRLAVPNDGVLSCFISKKYATRLVFNKVRDGRVRASVAATLSKIKVTIEGFELTRHAQHQMQVRRISPDWVAETLQNPERLVRMQIQQETRIT